VNLELLNADGGTDEAAGYYAAGYSVASRSYGLDCLVVVRVDLDSDSSFWFYLTGQDLTSDISNWNIQQPAASEYADVTLNGTDGTEYMGYLAAPGYAIHDDMGYIQGVFSGSNETTVSIYNPENYPMQWSTWVHEDGPPGSTGKMKLSLAAPSPFSSSITLPLPVAETGPTEIVDYSTFAWDGSTLSFEGANGANGYVVVLEDDSGYEMRVYVSSPSITFPSEFIASVLTPGSGWDVTEVMPAWSPDSLLDMCLHMEQLGGGPLGIDFRTVVVFQEQPAKVDVIP